MTINEELNQRLDYILRLVNNSSSFSKEEIKDQPGDTPTIKALKNNIRTTEIIKQKDKTIQSLQLKNENLVDSHKRLIIYLSETKSLVSHLQKDLQTEKQDKEHIQNELNNALEILNKPTTEIGTQTDLTAEQITQMEKDLETKRDELAKLAQDQKEQSEEYTKKAQELTQLQTKYDMEVKTKKELVSEISSLRSRSISEDEKFVLETLKKHGNTRQKTKEILDETGFNKSRLGNLPLPFSGFTTYYYLYSNWTVPPGW